MHTTARETRSRNNYYRTCIGISRSKYVGKKTLGRGHHNRLVAAPYRAPVWPWQSIGPRGSREEGGGEQSAETFLLPQLAASCDKTADFRTNLLHTAQIFNHAISKKCRSNISKTHELKLIKNTAIHRRYFKRLTYPPLIVTRTLESGHSKFGALTLQHLNVSKQVNILLNLFSHFLILESSR